MILVFMSNRSQVGKSTAAKLAVQHGYKHVSFAEPIRKVLDFILQQKNIDYNYFKANKHIPIPDMSNKTYVELMISLGTDWGRIHVGEDVWLDQTKAEIEKLIKDDIVIDDLRFPNEYEYLTSVNAVICRIIRPGLKLAQDGKLSKVKPHYIIHNNGTLNTYLLAVEALLHRIKCQNS